MSNNNLTEYDPTEHTLTLDQLAQLDRDLQACTRSGLQEEELVIYVQRDMHGAVLQCELKARPRQ